MSEESPWLLELIDVSRAFPGVQALDRVSFSLAPGEVHALVGENGAGKSTLINVVSGVLRPDSGSVRIGSANEAPESPVIARQLGVVTVHQESELFPTLSLAENLALMSGLTGRNAIVDWGALYDSAERAVGALRESIDVRRPAAELSVAHRQMTQVASAVSEQSKIVILDEPTSALSQAEAEWLFEHIAELKSAGAGIVYISHRQEEVFRLADRITVLRDGRNVWTGAASETNPERLVEQMVGRPEEAWSSHVVGRPGDAAVDQEGRVRLSVNALSHGGGRFRDVSLQVRAGEIVGVYGLVGSGRSEFARTVFGLEPAASGTIEIDGQGLAGHSAMQAVRAGLALVPEDRLRQALCRALSIRSNVVLASLKQLAGVVLASRRRELAATAAQVDQLGVKCRDEKQSIGELSGGNQQKVVLGRWILTKPGVLILDEPTRGVDVRSKAEIHQLLRKLADSGVAVLMISSELPEVMSGSDRIMVFREGTVSGEFVPRDTTAEQIAEAAFPADAPRGQDEDAPSGEGRNIESTDARSETKPARSISQLPLTEAGLFVIVVVLGGWLSATSDGFNPAVLLTSASLWTVLGLAAASVIIVGGIDISVGAIVALSAVAAAFVLRLDGPPVLLIPTAVLFGAATGAAAGALNGALSLVGRVHPIVITLGTMTVYRGLVILLLGGKPMSGFPDSFQRLAVDPASGFRGLIVAAVVITVAVWFWLGRTRSGRFLYAEGSSPSAARLAGIPRTQTWLTAFAVGGMLAGLGGALQLALSGQMQAQLGMGWELSAIAVAVIGGVAITGGRGTVVGVVLGAILLRLVNSALVRWEVAEEQVDLVVGAMILAAVLLDRLWRGRQES